MLSKKIFVMLILVSFVLHGRDAILEFKGAGFFPTNRIYKNIYGNGGTYGLEGTLNLFCQNIYGFASINFLQERGLSLCLRNDTKVNLIELGIGLKYLIPFCYGDFYVGLGLQPVRVQTKDYSPFVRYKNTKWGCGGVAKLGAFFNVPCNFVVDVFIDYSFVKAKFKCAQAPAGFVEPRKASLDAAIVGVGLGYRFN